MDKKYSLIEIWEMKKETFIAKKGDFYYRITKNPLEQYKKYKCVKGYIAKNIKDLYQKAWDNIYGWDEEIFTLIK